MNQINDEAAGASSALGTTKVPLCPTGITIADVWPDMIRRERQIWEKGSGFTFSPPFFDEDAAKWFNCWSSGPARFHGGLKVGLAGASESGKTTLANLITLSALHQGLPVMFYQAELSPPEHARDLMAIARGLNHSGQIKDFGEVPNWDLEYPPEGEVRDVLFAESAIIEWANERKGGQNPCRGVVLFDYLQLVHDQQARSDHQDVETVASRLTSLAGQLDIVVILLSQVSMAQQRSLAQNAKKAGLGDFVREQAKTAFSGGDVRRVFDCAFYNAAVVIDGVPRRFVAKCKGRGQGWGDEEGDDIIEYKFHRNGRFSTVGYGLEKIEAAAVPKDNDHTRASLWIENFLEGGLRWRNSQGFKADIIKQTGMSQSTAKNTWRYLKQIIEDGERPNLLLRERNRNDVRIYKKEFEAEADLWIRQGQKEKAQGAPFEVPAASEPETQEKPATPAPAPPDIHPNTDV